MGQDTSIQWTDHTFNPWWGCVKVHAGCKNCYAEGVANRWGFEVWGPNTRRRTFADAHWAEPVKWNAIAKQEGRSHRVFCASMADVFEDHPELPEQRKRLFDLICRTPFLDWQVLTKRPENALRMMVESGLYAVENPECLQPNLWIGTSPCDQKTADESIPDLMRVPAAIRFLSIEPLIGRVDLMRVNADTDQEWDVVHGWKPRVGPEGANTDRVDWVIVGGESGRGARPCFDETVREIVQQCQRAGVPVFVKQLGSNARRCGALKSFPMNLKDSKGGDPSEWPEDLRVREFPIVEVSHA